MVPPFYINYKSHFHHLKQLIYLKLAYRLLIWRCKIRSLCGGMTEVIRIYVHKVYFRTEPMLSVQLCIWLFSSISHISNISTLNPNFIGHNSINNIIDAQIVTFLYLVNIVFLNVLKKMQLSKNKSTLLYDIMRKSDKINREKCFLNFKRIPIVKKTITSLFNYSYV